MLNKIATSVTYRGGDGTAVFLIPFPFIENGHIQTKLETTGATRELAAGVDFLVNRVSEDYGELILLRHTLDGDDCLTIRRHVPATQEIPFAENGGQAFLEVEEAFDKLTMLVQQLQARMDELCSEKASSDGTMDHSRLANRSAPDQHPQSAIVNLERDLADMRADVDRLRGELLPDGGGAGDILVRGSGGGATWAVPAQVAAFLLSPECVRTDGKRPPSAKVAVKRARVRACPCRRVRRGKG